MTLKYRVPEHEGANLAIEYRWAEGQLGRLPDLASELVRLKVDLIVTHGTPGSRAAKQATTTIPVVVVVSDPVRNGVVASLSRPGANVTGLSLQDAELTPKRLEILKQAVPTASWIGFLRVPGVQSEDVEEFLWKETDAAARTLGLMPTTLMVSGPNDLTRAFSFSARQGVSAIHVQNTSVLRRNGATIAALAEKHRLPTAGASAFVALTSRSTDACRWSGRR